MTKKWPFSWLKPISHRHILQSYIILILDRLEEKEIIVDGCHGEDMHQWNVLIIRGHEVMYHYIIFNKSDRVSKWSSHFRMGTIPWESKFNFCYRLYFEHIHAYANTNSRENFWRFKMNRTWKYIIQCCILSQFRI